MNRRGGWGLRHRWVMLAIIVLVSGCSSTVEDRIGRGAAWDVVWDVSRAEEVSWNADDPSFSQNFELEASGLAVIDKLLFIPSEKYARILVMPAAPDPKARVVRLDVPRHSELEGIAIGGSSVFLCDEAHAAVYEIRLGDLDGSGGSPSGALVKADQLPLDGLGVEGGKIGFEGIEYDSRTGRVLLLLERGGDESTGCFSRIFTLEREEDRLVLAAPPLDVGLEDCNWRLTGLAWRNDRLVALKTQYPGERYQILEIDLESGGTALLQDLTTLMRGLPAKGWSNNIEGIAFDEEGALWLVADSAVTDVIDDPVPPTGDEGSLLLRIPAAYGH